MTTRIMLAAMGLVVGTCLSGMAFETPKPPSQLVEGPMTTLAPILGTWEINGTWKNGEGITARNEYTIGVGGKFVYAKTFAEGPNGGTYQRYFTVFGYDEAEQQYRSWGFTYDGSAISVPLRVEEEGDKVKLTSEWSNDKTGEIRQTVTIGDKDAYGWQVWAKTPDGEWLEIMDGEWKRVTD